MSNQDLEWNIKQPSRRSALILAAIIVLAAFLRLAYFVEQRENPLPLFVAQSPVFDQHNFLQHAMELYRQGWLNTAPAKFSPGYPYFLSTIFKWFGPKLDYAYLAQMALGTITIFVFYRVGALLFNSITVGLLSAVLAGFYAPFIFNEANLLRDLLPAYFNLWSFYFLLYGMKSQRPLAFGSAGVSLGLSFIIRPNILSVAVIIFLLVSKNIQAKTKAAILFVAGMAIVVAPFLIRNLIVDKTFALERQGPAVFWIGNTYDSPGVGFPVPATQGQLIEESENSLIKTAWIFVREWAAHPKEYAELYSRKIMMFFNAYEIPSNLSFELAYRNSFVLKWAVVNFGIIVGLAFLGIVLARRHPQSRLLYVFWGILSLSVVLFHIQERYRLAVVPFFILPAAYAVYWLAVQFKTKQLAALGRGMLIVILGLGLTRPDETIIAKYFGGRIRKVDYGNLADSYFTRAQSANLPIEQRTHLLNQGRRYYQAALATPNPSFKQNPQLDAYYQKSLDTVVIQLNQNTVFENRRALTLDTVN